VHCIFKKLPVKLTPISIHSETNWCINNKVSSQLVEMHHIIDTPSQLVEIHHIIDTPIFRNLRSIYENRDGSITPSAVVSFHQERRTVSRYRSLSFFQNKTARTCGKSLIARHAYKAGEIQHTWSSSPLRGWLEFTAFLRGLLHRVLLVASHPFLRLIHWSVISFVKVSFLDIRRYSLLSWRRHFDPFNSTSHHIVLSRPSAHNKHQCLLRG